MKNIYIVVLLSLVVLFNGCREDFLETTSTQTVDEQQCSMIPNRLCWL